MNGDCLNESPGYKCNCHRGYEFDGTTCIDTNECLDQVCDNGVCINTKGKCHNQLLSVNSSIWCNTLPHTKNTWYMSTCMCTQYSKKCSLVFCVKMQWSH